MSAKIVRTAEQRAAELQRLAAIPDKDIDTSDIPQITDWSGAEIGKFYRPVQQQVTMRINADVLAWFKGQGETYQTAVNKALREHMMRGRGKVG